MTVTLPRTLIAGAPENVNHVQENDEALRDGINTHIAATTNVHGVDDFAALRTSADVPIIRVARKTADETVNNSTTLQNDNHLALTVGANEVWEVRVYLLLSAAGTLADWKFGFTVPAAATFYWGHHGGSAATWDIGGTGDPNQLTTTGTVTHGSETFVHGGFIRGIYVGGANAGTLQFQWAQNTANASNSLVLTNSCMVSTKLSS